MSRAADVIDCRAFARLTDLLTARLEHDELHLARIAMRHHYFDDSSVLATEVLEHPLAGEPAG